MILAVPEPCAPHMICAEDHLGLAAKFVLEHFGRRQGRLLSSNSSGKGTPVEDTEEYSIACEALLRASRSHKPECGSFSNYAYRCMRNAFVSRARHKTVFAANATDISVPTETDYDGGEENHQDGVLEVPQKQNCTLDRVILIEELFSSPENERERLDQQMLKEYYLEGMTLKQLGEKYALTAGRIQQRITRAISTIRAKHRIEHGV